MVRPRSVATAMAGASAPVTGRGLGRRTIRSVDRSRRSRGEARTNRLVILRPKGRDTPLLRAGRDAVILQGASLGAVDGVARANFATPSRAWTQWLMV